MGSNKACKRAGNATQWGQKKHNIAMDGIDNGADYQECIPRPDSMIESLRAFGYSLPNAVADIVDNSIAAGATRIDVQMNWGGPNSWVRIRDNGKGMDEDELVEAMRLGTKSPLEERDNKDLGRFGLGLKTASFSQCRCLIVRSKIKGSEASTRCWDLDIVGQKKKWMLLKCPPSNSSEEVLDFFESSENGTIVLWQRMDRVVGSEEIANKKAHDRFNRRINEVSEHLDMAFHSYINGHPSVELKVNGSLVHGWDPFLTEHKSTQRLPTEVLGPGGREIVVSPFILPHESKLSELENNKAAGQRSWTGQQGFYIYRNNRLIVDGNWLGLFHQAEPFKLARIRIDISNQHDHEWKIDVRKAQAQAPDWVRDDLRRIGLATRRQAKEVYGHRGAKLRPEGDSKNPQVYVWVSLQKHGKIYYTINRDHPLIKQLLENPDPMTIKSILSLIEETIPVPVIIANFSDNKEQLGRPFEHANTPKIMEQLIAVAGALKWAGMDEGEVRKRLLCIDPFQEYPDLVASFSFDSIDECR